MEISEGVLVPAPYQARAANDTRQAYTDHMQETPQPKPVLCSLQLRITRHGVCVGDTPQR